MNEWGPREVLAIGGALAGAVTVVAVVRTQLSGVLERLAALERSRDKQGERLGKLETRQAIHEDRTRRKTQGVPLPVHDDDGSG